MLKTCSIHLTKRKEDNGLDKLKEKVEELTNEIKALKTAMKICKTTTDEIVPQLKTKVIINKREVEVTVNSGADVNYVNEEWCEQQKFQVKTQGYGWVKSYNGRWKKVPKRIANKHRIQNLGKISKTDI